MPVAFDYDRDSGLVRTTAEGLVTEEDWVRHVRALERAGLLEVRQLLDARRIIYNASSDEVRRLASFVRAYRGRRGTVRTAFVATEPHVYGLARMYGAMTMEVDPGFAVFDDLGAAEAWLQGNGEGD
jgi:DNA-binding MarR family transcriptional regulator